MKKAVAAAQTGGGDSFEAIAREWFERNKSKWTPKHGERVLLRLEQNMFPYIGKIHIGILTAPQILLSLRKIEERGAIETAHRVLQECGCVCRYAVATDGPSETPRPTSKARWPRPYQKTCPPSSPPPKSGGSSALWKAIRVPKSSSRPSSCPSRICAARRTQASGMDGV